jgi:hypothetical protein
MMYLVDKFDIGTIVKFPAILSMQEIDTIKDLTPAKAVTQLSSEFPELVSAISMPGMASILEVNQHSGNIELESGDSMIVVDIFRYNKPEAKTCGEFMRFIMVDIS